MIMEKSPKYGCHFCLAPIWLFGAACTPRQYFCLLLGTNKVVVVVVDARSESSCDSTSGYNSTEA